MSSCVPALLSLALTAPGVRVGVAPATGSGDAVATHVETVEGTVRGELAPVEGVEVSTLGQAIAPDCNTPDCLVTAAGDDLTHVVRSSLTASEQDYDLRLEVLDTRSGKVVASAVGSCEVCTQVEVGEMVTRTAARLREPLAALVVQPALLVVDGAPTGAEVAVDGTAVGATPYQGEVAPGAHQLVVTSAGHHSYTESWTAESGQTFTSNYALEPIDESLRSPALRTAGWASVGVGLGGLVGGVTLLALHNRPDKSSCPGGETDENGRCPDMYDTLGAGLGVTAAGLALTGVGAALLIVDAKKRKRASVAATPRSVTFRLAF